MYKILHIHKINIMQISNFIQNYTITDILKIESQDPQFLSLKNAWINISNKLKKEKTSITISHKNCFLSLAVQNAMICYQLSGTGEQYRQEFSQTVDKDFEKLFSNYKSDKSNLDRWKTFLQNSNYNKRINNIKYKKLEKMDNFFHLQTNFTEFNKDLLSLYTKLLSFASSKNSNKTSCLACKIYWYSYASITWADVYNFPMSVPIPYDSRLEKIYKKNNPNPKATQKDVKQYYQNLSEKYSIPPLHLDSLLWIEYWDKYM